MVGPCRLVQAKKAFGYGLYRVFFLTGPPLKISLEGVVGVWTICFVEKVFLWNTLMNTLWLSFHFPLWCSCFWEGPNTQIPSWCGSQTWTFSCCLNTYVARYPLWNFCSLVSVCGMFAFAVKYLCSERSSYPCYALIGYTFPICTTTFPLWPTLRHLLLNADCSKEPVLQKILDAFRFLKQHEKAQMTRKSLIEFDRSFKFYF